MKMRVDILKVIGATVAFVLSLAVFCGVLAAHGDAEVGFWTGFAYSILFSVVIAIGAYAALVWIDTVRW